MNVALISGWHVHAGEYFNRFNKNPNSQITAVWDEIPQRGKAFAEKNGSRFYECYDELLADPTIDAVCITSPTNLHPDLMIKAAKAGKHIFTEKVLAIAPEDARAIAAAVKEAGVAFTICFPHESEPPFLVIRDLLDSGKLGKITYAKFRKAHTGSIDNWLPDFFYDKEQCGGGAMMDLGAHPMYLLEWALGKTKAVTSTFTDMTGRGVEDNAVSVLEFEGGAIGVSETSFVSWGNPLVFEISGTNGWLLMTDSEIRYQTRESGGWVTPELPPRALHPVDYFVDCVVNGKVGTMYTVDEALNLTLLMDAAYKSAETGTKVAVEA
jgi:predicted dehydrogenase